MSDNLLRTLLDSMPLRHRLRAAFLGGDKPNWSNGEYHGDIEAIDRHVEDALELLTRVGIIPHVDATLNECRAHRASGAHETTTET